MAEQQRLTAQWSMDPKTGSILRKEMFGEEVVREEIVARYDADPKKQIVYFKSQTMLHKFKTGVVTFLASNEMLVRSFQREDMKADAPLSKNIPPRPKKDPMQGDKTPAVVEWYFKYRFNEFCARYGVFLDQNKEPVKYNGRVSFMEPIWRDRPGDGEKEFIGEVRRPMDGEKPIVVTDALVSQSKTHLTYLPSECLDLDEEDPSGFDAVVDDDDELPARVGAGKEGAK